MVAVDADTPVSNWFRGMVHSHAYMFVPGWNDGAHARSGCVRAGRAVGGDGHWEQRVPPHTNLLGGLGMTWLLLLSLKRSCAESADHCVSIGSEPFTLGARSPNIFPIGASSAEMQQ